MFILNYIINNFMNLFSDDIYFVRKNMEVNFFSYVVLSVVVLFMLKQSNGSIVIVFFIVGEQGGNQCGRQEQEKCQGWCWGFCSEDEFLQFLCREVI